MDSVWIKTTLSITALICLSVTPTPGQNANATARIVSAANTFLSTLDSQQRAAVLFPFDDAEQRKRWSNFPTGMVPRAGVSLKEMTSQQQSAAMELLAIVLSPMGYEKVNQIRLADDDFKLNGSQRGPRGGGPPGGN